MLKNNNTNLENSHRSCPALCPSVVHLESEVLEGQEPPRYLCVGVLRAGHPFEWRMVGDERELPAKEIVP